MVHLGVGGQYVVEGGKAYPTNPEEVMVETKKMVSFFLMIYLEYKLFLYLKSMVRDNLIMHECLHFIVISNTFYSTIFFVKQDALGGLPKLFLT